jgi:hypothetical protein
VAAAGHLLAAARRRSTAAPAKATEAASAADLGGAVDRVVALDNGDYEVHYTGVTGRYLPPAGQVSCH